MADSMKRIGKVRNWWYNRITPKVVKEMLQDQHVLIEMRRDQSEAYRSEIQELTEENNMLIAINAELKRDLTTARDKVNGLRVVNMELMCHIEVLEEANQ